jgi:hypothetical protein
VRLSRPTITCPALPPSCSVTAKVDRAGVVNPVIAMATSTIAAGKRATIRFTLNRSARARLRRRGRLAARVRITARHGALVRRRTVQLTLRRAR